MEGIRLNKYLSEMGVCSRREADRLIAAGKVLIEGKTAKLGDRVTAVQRIVCDGKPIGSASAAFHDEKEKKIGNNPEVQKPCPSSGSGRLGREFPTEGRSVMELPTCGGSGTELPTCGRSVMELPTCGGSGTELPTHGRPRQVLLAVNKPRGIVCTTSNNDRAPNIVDMIRYPERIYPAGRLDKDSEGLILMTNQGDLVNRLMRGSGGHEKEYVVTVDKAVTADFIRQMEAGLWLDELKIRTKPCRAWAVGRRKFHIVLTQGLNRQIRRMCGALGYHVQALRRIRIMNICLGNLKEGTFRNVTGEEYEEMLALLDRDEADRAGNLKNPSPS